jgi:hypothetical protein
MPQVLSQPHDINQVAIALLICSLAKNSTAVHLGVAYAATALPLLLECQALWIYKRDYCATSHGQEDLGVVKRMEPDSDELLDLFTPR